jgi:hypothetical protein
MNVEKIRRNEGGMMRDIGGIKNNTDSSYYMLPNSTPTPSPPPIHPPPYPPPQIFL